MIMYKQSKIILYSCFVAIVIRSILFGKSIISDQSVLWHFKSGEWMLEHRAIPHFDPFLSWTENVFWLSDQWLADIIFYLLLHLGGLPLLGILTEVILALAFFCIPFVLSQRVTNNTLINLTVALICAASANVHWFCRPFIFGFLFFNLTYLIAWTNYGQTTPKRNIYFLPLIFCLWANLHPSFMIGVFVYGVFLLCSLDCKNIVASIRAKREYFIVGVLSLLAILINPYGYELYIHAFDVAGGNFIPSFFTEWMPLNFRNPMHLPFSLTLFLIISGLYLAKRVAFTVPEIVCFIVMLVASLLYSRYTMFFAITLVVPLTKILLECAPMIRPETVQFFSSSHSPTRHNWIIRGGIVFLSVAIAVWLIVSPKEENRFSYPKKYPLKAVEHIASLDMEGAKLFNNMNWGGVVTYFLYPKYKAFLDDRASLVGEEMYKKYVAFYSMETNWEDVFKEFEFDIMLLEPKLPAATFLRMNADWKLSYEDEQAVVFVKAK